MKKNGIWFILMILFLWLVISRFTELEQIEKTLSEGQWNWVLLALFFQILSFAVFTSSFQAAFSSLGIRIRHRDLLPVTLGSLFLNVVIPGGFAGGTALFAESIARRGNSATRATAGVLLQLISDLTSFTLILVPGLGYLFFVHELKTYDIIAASLLLLLISGLASVLLMGIWRPQWLFSLLRWSHRVGSWISKRLNRRLTLADDWAEKNADEFTQAASTIASNPSSLARTIGISLLAHLLNMTTLFIMFQAFDQSIDVGTLVAGYAIGVLFRVVSPTPQGIGVVEGMMTLTLASLGISGSVAATVSVAFRGVTFWLPMLLGFFAVQRLRAFRDDQRILTEVWGVRFAAVMTTLMGAVNILSGLRPSLADKLKSLELYSPLEVRHGGYLTSALAGFALILLAHGLWRRKRLAWLLSVVVLGLSIIAHLIKGNSFIEILLAFGLTVMLLLMRSHFHAHSDQPSMKQGFRVLLGAAVFTLIYGVTGLYLLDRHYSVNFGFWAALQQTVIMFTQFYDPGLVPLTQFGHFFADSIYLVGALSFSYAGLILLRPILYRLPASVSERSRAKEIVEKFGHSSVARFVLFDDKRYFFTKNGSVLGYTLIGRTAVTLGDPIGPDDDLLTAIKEFSAFCQQNDWRPVFYQTTPDTLSAYKRAGYNAVCIGEEGIVDLGTFTLEGKEAKPLRAPINKLTNAGYKFIVHEPPISAELLEELRSISDEWLTFMHGSEKKFSLGWFHDEYIQNSLIGAIHSPEGWVTAFVNFVPEYQKNEITVDLMRRRSNVENGSMEFLFVSLFEWARSNGYQGFDLGLSALYGVGEKSDDPLIEKVMHWIYENVDQFYNFKGIHSFKQKFHPNWSPRYMIYPGAADLAQSWTAVVRANSGGTFPIDLKSIKLDRK